jgi:glycosyltransferase involved in cell wall biosynthesis
MIAARSLQGNIQLLGDVPHAEVLSMMQSAKIFLHPSAYEGFSTACNEALYAGAQVIAFCKPMNKNFDHLHIVSSAGEMTATARDILFKNKTHDRILTYSIAETCARILQLYE